LLLNMAHASDKNTVGGLSAASSIVEGYSYLTTSTALVICCSRLVSCLLRMWPHLGKAHNVDPPCNSS
jgi:hypothetical protein